MKLTMRECPDRMQPCSVNFDIHRIDHRTVFTILNRKIEKRKKLRENIQKYTAIYILA